MLALSGESLNPRAGEKGWGGHRGSGTWKCCYKNIQWEEEVSPLFTSFPQKTKKRFQCSVEGLRMRSLGHLAGADEKGL